MKTTLQAVAIAMAFAAIGNGKTHAQDGATDIPIVFDKVFKVTVPDKLRPDIMLVDVNVKNTGPKPVRIHGGILFAQIVHDNQTIRLGTATIPTLNNETTPNYTKHENTGSGEWFFPGNKNTRLTVEINLKASEAKVDPCEKIIQALNVFCDPSQAFQLKFGGAKDKDGGYPKVQRAIGGGNSGWDENPFAGALILEAARNRNDGIIIEAQKGEPATDKREASNALFFDKVLKVSVPRGRKPAVMIVDFNINNLSGKPVRIHGGTVFLQIKHDGRRIPLGLTDIARLDNEHNPGYTEHKDTGLGELFIQPGPNNRKSIEVMLEDDEGGPDAKNFPPCERIREALNVFCDPKQKYTLEFGGKQTDKNGRPIDPPQVEQAVDKGGNRGWTGNGFRSTLEFKPIENMNDGILIEAQN